jgi:23S rRNA pseudouridine1911/1915/1917 synthase
VNEHIVVPAERAGLELDEFLCLLYPECGKGFLRRQVRDGLVLVDGQRALPSMRLAVDQVLMVDFDEDEAPAPPVDPGIPIPILHEDDDLLVLDKPSGLSVEPERWAREAGSVAGALLALARTRTSAGPADGPAGALDERLRGVHRLDKDTSGCLVVARHLEAERALRKAFEDHAVEKTYLALVEGEHPLADGEEAVIDLAIGPDERRSGRVVIDEKGGKPARTRIAVAERFRGYTLMRCHPESGRTHQIRVHLAAMGFPLAVDPLYGRRDALLLSDIKAGYRPKKGRPERPLVQRLTLHAERIRLASPGHPGRAVEVAAPLPRDLSQLLKQLGKVRAWQR